MAYSRSVKIIFICFFAFLAAGMFFLPESTDNIALEENIYIEKTNNPKPIDVIAVGDSRVNRGLNTIEVAEQLGLKTAINLGYTSGGFGKDLLELANRYRKSNSIIIIGITEWAFTPKALLNEHLKSFVGRTQIAVLPKQLQARSLNTIKSQLLRKPILAVPMEDGYIKVQDLFRSEFEHLGRLKDLYDQNKIDTSSINTCILYIKKWQSEGNTIVCYMPPVPDTIRKAEVFYSGINVPEYLKSKGISVLEFEYEGNFYTYDGSHLDDTSGLKLSKWIAKEISSFIK